MKIITIVFAGPTDTNVYGIFRKIILTPVG